MVPEFTEFDSISLNGASDEYLVWVPDTAQTPTTVTIQSEERPFLDPIYRSWTPTMRKIPFSVWPGPTAPADAREFGENVRKLFKPKAGPRILRGLRSGAVEVSQAVLIESIDLRPQHLAVYDGVFILPGDSWLGEVQGPDDTSPIDVGGTESALPVIDISAETKAITSNSVANPTVITFAVPHGFSSGQRIKIEGVTGGTPSINGEHVFTSTGASTGTIPVNVSVGGTGGTAKAVIRRARLTATDQTGRGLDSFIIQVTIDASNSGITDHTDFEVFTNGHSVPFAVDYSTPSSTKVNFRISTLANGETLIDIYFGKGVNNTITANVFDDGGLDLTNTDFSNTRWIWRTTTTTAFGKLVYSMFDISRNPRVAGAWSLGRFGRTYSGLNWGYTQGATAVFTIGPSNGFGAGLDNDHDGIILFTQVEAISTNALQGIAAALTSGLGGTTIAVEYLRADDLIWQPAGNGFATGGWDIDGAIAVRIYIKPLSAASQGVLTISAYGTDPPPEIHLDSTKVPLLSSVTYTTAQILNGTLSNDTTGDEIEFINVLFDDDATFRLDCLVQLASVSSGPGPYGQILPTNEEYMPLQVGENHFTNPTGFKASFSWTNRYS